MAEVLLDAEPTPVSHDTEGAPLHLEDEGVVLTHTHPSLHSGMQQGFATIVCNTGKKQGYETAVFKKGMTDLLATRV
jgi:hypothetical protein